MIAIEDIRPLFIDVCVGLRIEERLGTYELRTSLNSHAPRRAPATPRTALETMWVIGDVTLIERRLAILIKNPSTPYITR